MPVPSKLLFRGFACYARRYVTGHFHGVRLSGSSPGTFDGTPLIVYLNHPSWWDPMICIVLATTFFPGRSHYGPIDSAGLARYPILRRLGFFGIDPEGRRGAAAFLRYSESILADANSVLWITAEGQFTDPRQRPTRLRPGIAHLVRRLSRGVALPLAVEYPFWQERTPEALVRFGQPFELDILENSVAEWKALLEAGLQRAKDELAASAMTRDKSEFVTLLGGRAGVGGIYGSWLRFKAMVAGRQFVPEHEQ